MNRAFPLMLILIVASPLVFTPAQCGYVPNKGASPEMQSQGSFSSSDPLEIFLYVRNNFIFEPYYGYMKGVNGTLNAGGGNDFDQASLLVHLLRRANVQARYVEGWITLNMGELGNWLGVETSNATLRILKQWDIIYQVRAEGAQTVVQLGHVWVEAYLEGAWVQMDPSFKQYEYHEPVMEFPPGLSPLPMPNGTSVGAYGVANIDTRQIWRAIDYIQEKSNQAIDDLKGTHPFAYRTIVPAKDYSVPYKSQVMNVYDEIPVSKQYSVEVTIPSFDPSINDFTFTHNVSAHHPTTLLSESRVTLYFVPVDDKTLKYIQSFPNLIEDEHIDLSKVKMRPVLKFNSTRGIMGEAMPLGYFMPLKVRILLGDREFRVSRQPFRPQVGAWNSLVVNTGDSHLDDNILLDRIRQLNETNQALGQRKIDIDDILGALLDVHGRTFYRLVNERSLLMQDSYGVRQVHTVDVILTGFKYDWIGSDRAGWRLQSAGPFMDWQVGGWGLAISCKDEFSRELLYNLMYASVVSFLEGEAIHLIYRTAPVSAGTLLEAANAQDIPIFMITESNWNTVAPQLSQPDDVMNALRENVKGDWGAIVPQRPVTTTALTLTMSEHQSPLERISTYSGTGWIQCNFKTLDTNWIINNVGAARPLYDSSLKGGGGGVYPHNPYNVWWDIGWWGDVEIDWWGGVPPLFDPSWFAILVYQMVGPNRPPPVMLSHLLSHMLSEIQNTLSMMVETETGFYAHYIWSHLIQEYPDIFVSPNPLSASSSFANGGGTNEGETSLGPLFSKQSSILGLGGLETEQARATSSDTYHSILVAILNLAFLAQYNTQRSLAYLEQPLPELLTGTPSFAMYLADDEGHKTGFDPMAMQSYLAVNHVFVNVVAAKNHTIGIWNLPAGNYTIMLLSSTDQSLPLFLTSNMYQGQSSSSQNRRVEMPEGGGVAVTLDISYDTKGEMNVRLSEPVPAVFIRFDKAEGKTVRGQLLDTQLQGLEGREVTFFYRPPLSFTGWTSIGSAKTSANGNFILEWNAAPPGESTIMVTYGDYFRAFTYLPVPFPVRASIHDLKGEPLTDREVTITSNNKTASSAMRNGSVAFEAYPGYNVIEVSPLVKAVVYTPVPCDTIAVQLSVQEVTSTSTTMLSSSVTSASPTLAVAIGLPNIMIIAALAAVVLLITGAIIINRRQRSKQTKEP